MPKFRHTVRGTVVTTTSAPGPGWELADSPAPKPETQAPAKKPAAKKAAPKTPAKE